jgi:hypothetical protein
MIQEANMSHNINGYIGPIQELQRLTTGVKSAKIALLDVDGYGFLPYTNEIEAEVGEKWFNLGRDAVVPIVHVETDYFGGAGEQSAAFWDGKGAKTYKAKRSGAIDHALNLLGIQALDGVDEFDTLGLGNYRSNEDWANSSTISEEQERLDALAVLDALEQQSKKK